MKTCQRIGLTISVFLLVQVLPVLAVGAERVEFPSGAGKMITGDLHRPKEKGPIPALVLLHGASGVRMYQRKMAFRLAEWGYAALVVDSLGPRGFKNTGASLAVVSPFTRAHDAHGALKYLQSLAFVDPERVGVIGWSHGGWTIMSVMQGDSDDPSIPSTLFTQDAKLRFKAAIAYYPWCPLGKKTFYGPLLILIGEADDWTPTRRCKVMVGKSQAGGKPIRMKTYPGATHAFDAGVNRTVLGHRIASDPAAREDALIRVRDFLAANL
ncbi:MAG: dienelactone hydrolase family protein [SAR324 cluster bacterium]|nr:dienelactone hydrolase family protein [SAR324 cluster bacterium]